MLRTLYHAHSVRWHAPNQAHPHPHGRPPAHPRCACSLLAPSRPTQAALDRLSLAALANLNETDSAHLGSLVWGLAKLSGKAGARRIHSPVGAQGACVWAIQLAEGAREIVNGLDACPASVPGPWPAVCHGGAIRSEGAGTLPPGSASASPLLRSMCRDLTHQPRLSLPVRSPAAADPARSHGGCLAAHARAQRGRPEPPAARLCGPIL